MNKALLGKLGWVVIKENSSIWANILRAKYLRNPLDLLGENPLPRGSELWNSLLNYRELLRAPTTFGIKVKKVEFKAMGMCWVFWNS